MRRSLGIREQAYGAQSPKVAQSLSNLGAVLLDLQRPKEALEVLGRALAIKEKTAGPSAPTVAVTLTNLATGQRAVGELTAAIASDQRALEIRKATLGPGHPELARNLVGLGASQVALGNASAARALLEEALTVAGQTSVERGDADLLLARVLAKSDGPRCVTLLDDALKLWPATYSSRVDAEQLKKTCLATKKR
jgi:tetratricopeptide (TPR) repeat protein